MTTSTRSYFIGTDSVAGTRGRCGYILLIPCKHNPRTARILIGIMKNNCVNYWRFVKKNVGQVTSQKAFEINALIYDCLNVYSATVRYYIKLCNLLLKERILSS